MDDSFIRGGGWGYPAEDCRSAYRYRPLPSIHDNAVGFRVVKEVEPSIRVCRGGGWDFNAERCRSAYRSRYAPSFRVSDIGFRVVKEINNEL